MTDHATRVTLGAWFLERLAAIDAFWTDRGAPHQYDALLALLEEAVITTLRHFPQLGRRCLDRPPASVEAMAMLARLPAPAADALRVMVVDDYRILYLHDAEQQVVHLLSIRHHRELGFGPSERWG